MDFEAAAHEYEELFRTIKRLASRLKQIATLDQKRCVNSMEILRLTEISRVDVVKLESGAEKILDSLRQFRLYVEEIERVRHEFGAAFGLELANLVQAIGGKLSGHFPEWTAGLFTIQADTLKTKQILLWYGPREERLGICKAEPTTVVEQMHLLEATLFNRFSVDFFSQLLRRAYHKIPNPRTLKLNI